MKNTDSMEGVDFMAATASLRDWQEGLVTEWEKGPTCTSVNQILHALDKKKPKS